VLHCTKQEEVIAELVRNGWELKRTKGSHYIFLKNSVSLIVPFHKTLSTGVLENIKKRVKYSESIKKKDEVHFTDI
jgi:predicted RNA binding protein YcfA (HicA-like mRNA interferase family)